MSRGQTIDLTKVKTSHDAISAGLPVFKIFSDGAIKAYKDEKGIRRFSLTASSDADDLVGDFFSEKALKRMESAAGGTTMFLNHQYAIPEDVFGSVEKASLAHRKITLQSGEKRDILCLDYDGVVEESNPRAVNTHDMMAAGRVRLGASVSVLITEKSNTKDGRRRIEDVYYLECSIVGIPCNPTAWVQSASKALNLSTKFLISPGEADQIALASKVSIQMREILPLVEGHVRRGEDFSADDRETLLEAIELLHLDQLVRDARAQGVMLEVA